MSSSPRRKHGEHEEEEHENHERWLVSYADMITVLMALFLVLFAISIVDQGKFELLKKSLSSSLGQKVTALEGGKSPAAGTASGEGALNFGDALLPPTSPAMAAQVSKAVTAAKAAESRAEAERQRRDVEKELVSLEKIRREIVAALDKKKMGHAVQFRYDDRGLVVSVVTDKVLFAPNRAELSRTGHRALRTVGPVLRRVPNNLLVEGHTDTTAAGPKYYATEWELSSARATTVVRDLIDTSDIAPSRLSATGHADQRPLVKGTSPRANRINRRVEIVIVSTLSPQDRALIPVLARVLTGSGRDSTDSTSADSTGNSSDAHSSETDTSDAHASKTDTSDAHSSKTDATGTASPALDSPIGSPIPNPLGPALPAAETPSGDSHGNGHSGPADNDGH